MKLLCISLGCDKNLVDTEMMLGLLNKDGYTFTDDEYEADVIVINTCCFIGDAKEESVNTILEMARRKEDGNCKALIVTGCLAQRYKQEIIDEIPEVDGILGTSTYDEISRVLSEALGGKEHVQCFHELDGLPELKTDRVLTTGGHYAFLKIAEGCDKHCTYCIIPTLRGNYRSIPMERLIKEAEGLAEKGVKELILVAQETTLYGVDLYGKKALPELLKKLCRIPGIQWIRIQYCYPEEITDELIETIKEEEKICHYLDLPIQHASDRILKRMGRRTTKAQLREIVERLRREIPDMALRTTLISGFPGETEKDHEELMEFVDEMEFERLGVFAYSAEEDTPAAEFPDQVPEEVKVERRDAIMELQQEISYDHSQSMTGKILEVMIEGKVADESAYVGRTYMDGPGVDGMIFVQTGEELMSGDFARVRVTGAMEYDLIGELENEFTE
ncbi:30S ribosomal protein S12 methylthiotransferase RimO [Clostridium sp. Marseille-P2415]|uniref:30S ribosomal protein S12 methylthiotransferase RimO n=1 Tax=Clostridium sp. Marseille-P2415 TaxID=1805471 RepID=UPI00098891F8|nr:30S ribosomal protein S12 methylthiotransferase RimO [Clostridium sp. Marseille-P2415]